MQAFSFAFTALFCGNGAVISIIVGTNRPGSNSRVIAGRIKSLYTELQVPVNVIDLADLPAELFHPSSYGQKPDSFAPFANAVLNASGLHIVTPEYNGGMPGVLKYFIDMLKFPESFERKPVCFTGVAAGQWGALRPVEQLQQIFGYRNAHIFPERVFIPGVFNQLDDKGALKDVELVDRLRNQAAGFAAFVKRIQS